MAQNEDTNQEMKLLREFHEAWTYFHSLIMDGQRDKFTDSLMKHASQKVVDIHHKLEALYAH